MSYAIPDPRFEAPELLTPGRKPVGNIVIDWSKPITRRLTRCVITQGRDVYELVKGFKADDHATTATTSVVDKSGHVPQWQNAVGTDAGYDLGIYTDTDPNMSIFSIVTPADISNGPYSIINGDNNGIHRLWQFRVYQSKANFIRFTTAGIVTVTTTNNLTVNDINTISATHDTNNGGAIYLNGVQDNTDANGADMLTTELPSVALGAFQGATDSWAPINVIDEWRGTIACAFMWGRVLSPAEHKSLYLDPYQFLIPN